MKECLLSWTATLAFLLLVYCLFGQELETFAKKLTGGERT